MNAPFGSRVESPPHLSTSFCTQIMNYRHFPRTLTVLIGLLMLSLSALAQQPAFLTNGLVAYYPFDGGSFADVTGVTGPARAVQSDAVPTPTPDRFNNPAAALVNHEGGPSTNPYNNGLVLNNFHFNTSYTYSIWWQYKPNPRGAAGRISEYSFSEKGSGFSMAIIQEVPLRYEICFGPSLGCDSHNFSTNTTWHHSLIVVSATTNSTHTTTFTEVTFLDGYKISSMSVLGLTNYYPDLYIGGRGWWGSVDDVRIYNRAFSDGEAAALYRIESTWPGQGRPATLQAGRFNTFITEVAVIDGGTRYTGTPTIRITGGGGSGATATAVVSNGVIVSVVVTNPGENYTSDPIVVVEPPPQNPPRQAEVQSQLAGSFVVGATVSNGGTGYTFVPNVYVIGGGGTGATANAVMFNGSVAEVIIANPGTGYTSAPTIWVAPPDGFPATQATANATLQNGSVSSVALSNLGSGYGTTPPPVTILGGGGVGAKAVAVVVNGSVVEITITAPGTGYTSVPQVLIAAPPGLPRAAIAVSQVRVNLDLIPGYTYKIQTTTDAGNTWVDVETSILAVDATLVRTFDVTTNTQLFRVVQVN